MSYLALAKRLRAELPIDVTDSRAAAANDSLGLRVFSRILGEEVWLAADDASATQLEAELAAGSDNRLVFTLAEVEALRGMFAADMQKLVQIKRWFRGARIDTVTRRQEAPQ